MQMLETRSFVTKGVPRLPYEKVAAKALAGWDISLVFAGRARATTFNRMLRKKTYAPNVLSYVIGKKSGEIIICPEVAKSEAASYDMSYNDFVLYLFIHGLLHLKGHAHGTTMEKHERALLAQFTRSKS